MNQNVLSSLIELAHSTLSLEISPDLKLAQFVDLLVQYSESFEEWYNASGLKSLEANDIINIDPTQVDSNVYELLDIHSKIIDKACEILKNQASELAKLKLKGKGIMAYSDILPRKISLLNVRKG